MTTFPRSALRRIAHRSCAFFLAVGLVLPGMLRAEDAPVSGKKMNLHRLTVELENWLDANSPYPARDAPATILQVDPLEARVLSSSATWLGPRPRGYYDAATGTIYLIRPWSPDNPQDASVLLHELAHHRQVTARHWYCPGQQELPAYKLQEAWLQERGESGRINWIAAVLESGCTPRDIHPD